MKKRAWKEIIALIITIIVFALILSNINVSELIMHLLRSNLIILGLSILLFIPIFLLKSERWIILLKKYINLSLKDSTKYTMASLPYMAVTPSDAGDVVRAVYIRKHVHMTTGLTSIALEKVLDVFVLSLFSLIGLFILGSINSATIIVLLFSVIIILLVLILFFTNFVKNKFAEKLVNLICFLVKSKKIKSKIMEIQEFLINTDSSKIRKCFLITIFVWLFHFLQVYMIFLALGLNLGINLLFTFIPISLFIGMLPITIGGIGTRDAALLYFLAPFAPASLILSGAILITFIRVWLVGLAGLPFTKFKSQGKALEHHSQCQDKSIV